MYTFFQPNTFTYTVIGSCHRLEAAKQLAKGGNKDMETVEVQVYGSDVLTNRKAICWWAHQHNELEAMQLDFITQDKIIHCFHNMNYFDENNYVTELIQIISNLFPNLCL